MGTDVDDFYNRYLLRHGFATTMSIYPNQTFEDTFNDDESEARAADEGLWSECY